MLHARETAAGAGNPPEVSTVTLEPVPGGSANSALRVVEACAGKLCFREPQRKRRHSLEARSEQ